jgi:hypothetical protein
MEAGEMNKYTFQSEDKKYKITVEALTILSALDELKIQKFRKKYQKK